MFNVEACVGGEFIALHESGNDKDRHAMAVYWEKSINFRRFALGLSPL